ncbi:class I adenylate cyclase [Desulfobacula toluolica]|nr:class I adenylate cyclase [Desulfobacula toluolica]
MEKNRFAFSNYNMVRMREAVRNLSTKKLEIFIKIPFLLHINSPGYPGFIETRVPAHGIWNFEQSGFYNEIIKAKIFPKSIIENNQIDSPAILGFYHIGSIGTFTQSIGSDFDYWIIIDKKKFSKERYDALEKKLDAILRYCRESYDQKVSFFIMDQREIKNNCYAPFKGEETLTVPKIFLKEEFYRTFLMIAGKIPVWSVLPGKKDLEKTGIWNSDGLTAQILSMYDDLIDLGQITSIPIEDVLKGFLWHICKSKADPIKAVIKATMIFCYGFSQKLPQTLLCEKIKQGYSTAGIDDYGVDPYKALFDQILEFHDIEDPKGLSLIKNAVFFRLCEYPDVKLPDKNTPKRYLLDKYILRWKLNKNQVKKLLSYSNWSESEKLVLEKTYINRLAQMYNYAIRRIGKINNRFDSRTEKRNWIILRNKTKERLRKSADKICECSTYLKRRHILCLDIIKKTNLWEVNFQTQTGQRMDKIYKHSNFLGVLGWILENQLYRRQTASISLHTNFLLFESSDTAITADTLYMAFQPLKPLSDSCYDHDASWSKMMILLFYDTPGIIKAEFLISNNWGELFLDSIEFALTNNRQVQCSQMANLMLKYSDENLRLFIFQFSDTHDPDIVCQLKKAYYELACPDSAAMSIKKKPYLDRL